MKRRGQICAPISSGELLDKITILEIKSERIRDPAKLTNIRKELTGLTDAWRESGCAPVDIGAQRARLKAVNQRLWDIEDEIRAKEARGEFDEAFIQLARLVYFNNDERAALKREINLLTGSEVMEEKSYPDYARKAST
jgi:hypothetical protein